jgi:hypothetical protein
MKLFQSPSSKKVLEQFLAAAKASGQCPSLFPPDQTIDQVKRQPAVNQSEAELKREATQMAKVAQQDQPIPNQLPPQMPA